MILTLMSVILGVKQEATMVVTVQIYYLLNCVSLGYQQAAGVLVGI